MIPSPIPQIDLTDYLPSVLRTTIQVYKNRKNIYYWITRAANAAGLVQADIVVLGKPGTGKTLLINQLYGEVKGIDWTPPNSSDAVEKAVLSVNDWAAVVKVVPGQLARERVDYLHDMFVHGRERPTGVIYVVDYGFDDYREEEIEKEMGSRRDLSSLEKLRNYSLAQELEEFKGIVDKMIEAKIMSGKNLDIRMPTWMVVTINKADLFLSELPEAYKYYYGDDSSAFVCELKRLQSSLGSANFHIGICPVSAYPTTFTFSGLPNVASGITDLEAHRSSLRAYFDYLGRASSHG